MKGRATADRSRAGIRVVERAVQIVDILAAEERGLGVTEIARRVGLGKSTAHRLLASLVAAGVVRLDPATRLYTLGFRLLQWSASFLDRLDIRTRALPHLRELREACRETVSLNLRDGLARVAVERLETSHEIRFVVDLGRPLPLHVGAGGKAILAFLADDEVEAAVKGAGVRGRAREALLADLAEIRRSGTAVSHGERIPGSASVSAPVFNHEGRVIGSVSVLSLAVRLPPEALGAHRARVRAAADAISRELGWTGAPASPRPAALSTGRPAATRRPRPGPLGRSAPAHGAP